MRRSAVISAMIILLILPLSLFGWTSETTSHSFNIKGFYRDGTESSAQTLHLDVYQGSAATTRIYHAGDVTIDDRAGVTLTTETTVFNWKLTGENITSGFGICFSITPLQAFQSGLYFIPKHTYKMYRKTGGTEQSPVYETRTHQFATRTEGNYPYPGYRNGSDVYTTETDFYYTFNKTGSFVETGYCSLQINDEDTDGDGYGDGYDTASAVNFEYVSNVTVEFWTL